LPARREGRGGALEKAIFFGAPWSPKKTKRREGADIIKWLGACWPGLREKGGFRPPFRARWRGGVFALFFF